MAKKTHIHKYLLKTLGKKGSYRVYACVLDDCTHYMEARLALGKLCVCWRCGKNCKIQVTREGREIKRPHCVKCTKAYPHQVRPDAPRVSIEELENLDIAELLGGDATFPVSKKEH
jgi:hypothetical protein